MSCASCWRSCMSCFCLLRSCSTCWELAWQCWSSCCSLTKHRQMKQTTRLSFTKVLLAWLFFNSMFWILECWLREEQNWSAISQISVKIFCLLRDHFHKVKFIQNFCHCSDVSSAEIYTQRKHFSICPCATVQDSNKSEYGEHGPPASLVD